MQALNSKRHDDKNDMNPESVLAEMLTCSRCGAEGLSAADSELICRCGARCPLRDGVLHLPGQQAPSKTLSQDAMRFKPLIRIYDVLWRRMTFPFITFIPFGKEAKIIMGYHALNAGDRILDIACGPGTYARRFACAVGEGGVAVGADASQPMLNQAVRSAREEGLTNMVFVKSRADKLPFRPEQFNGINCTGALHLFDQLEPVFRDISSMLKPGGVFTCMTFCRSRFERVNATYTRLGIRLYDPGTLASMLRKQGLTTFTSIKSRRMLLFSARKIS